MIDDDIITTLLDRLEEASAKRGAAEVQIGHLAQFRDNTHREMSARDKEIGELKRLYDSTREELQVCQKDAELTLSMLRALYDAAAKTPNKTHSFRFSLKEALRNAKNRLDEEIPF